MNNTELQELLQSYNEQLKQSSILNMQSWVLNLQCFETLQQQKAKSKLNSLVNFKMVAVCLGVLWVFFLGYLFFKTLGTASIFFLISCGAIMIVTAIAIVVYVYHIVLLKKVDHGQSVVETQETIVHLQLSTLNVTRILFLQSPFYCTFWWSIPMIVSNPISFWLISFPVALLFFIGSIWLYQHISMKNTNKKWFKILFNSPEWNLLIKAGQFLEEINAFKKEMVLNIK